MRPEEKIEYEVLWDEDHIYLIFTDSSGSGEKYTFRIEEAAKFTQDLFTALMGFE